MRTAPFLLIISYSSLSHISLSALAISAQNGLIALEEGVKHMNQCRKTLFLLVS